MAEPLEEYRSKRDFARTPEPAPASRDDAARAPVFVVHRHDARNLHYDLRLEARGVLCSWAVPKGFSFDPKDKHLAVRTEDHPIEYEHFHGVIPKGQYGAGTMTIWDRGHYELLYEPGLDTAVAKGEIKIVLSGRKLRGEWHLVRLEKEPKSWLLFKSRDLYAGSARDSALGIDLSAAPEAELPESADFMRAEPGDAPFSDPAWVFEMEFDGRRVLAEKRGEATRLRGIDAPLPEVERALGRLRARDALLDGCLVVLDEHERPSRERLERRLRGESTDAVAFYAFDLLHYDEFDLRPLPLVDRKGALRAVLPETAGALFVDHVPGNGELLAETVARAGLPAVVAKRADAPYTAGPSDAWLRIPVAGAKTEHSVAEALANPSARAKSKRSQRVRFTNLDKVFWPAEGYTKGDLVAYYDRVADTLLPYLAERPVHMNRYPDGIEGKSFYQREAKDDFPDWIDTVPIQTKSHEAPVPHMICGDRDTLLFIANRGSIELHPWLSRRASLDSPDWCLLDLDPKEAPFAHVVTIARAIGELLRAVGLRPQVKTSGKTGIHIVVPLVPGYTYDHSRMFAEGVARVIARDHPDIATVERVIGSREGKVYVDYLQNRKAQTVVPPYSVRPVRGARVSMPLAWDELDDKLSMSAFTIQTAPERLERLGDLYRPALEDLQDLMPAVEKLQAYLTG